MSRRKVLLLRDMAAEQRLSMERFADLLHCGFSASSRFRLESTSVDETLLGTRLGLRRLDSYLARFVRYPLAAHREQACIYHVVDHGYAHLAAVLPRARTVVTCHDLMLLRAEEGNVGFRGQRLSVARFRWSTSYLRTVAKVVCPSAATKEDVIRLLRVPAERVGVVPQAVDPKFRQLQPNVRERARASLPGLQRVLHISTGHPYKNVATVLRVVAWLHEQGLTITLVRAGRSLREEERQLASALGLEGFVVDLGVVSEERLVELYNGCDVLIFPSYSEGFGWPVLEAMACGLPVVVSDIPVLRELVGAAGLRASPTDIEGLARNVASVLHSTVRRESLRRQGLARSTAYTMDRFLSGYERIYEAVLASAEGRASDMKGETTACVG